MLRVGQLGELTIAHRHEADPGLLERCLECPAAGGTFEGRSDRGAAKRGTGADGLFDQPNPFGKGKTPALAAPAEPEIPNQRLQGAPHASRHSRPVGRVKIALTIAGSDSGGGAGIQADLKTFHQFGVFGTSVIVAVTAQNTKGVRAVEPVSSSLVQAQLDALAEDLPPDALKTGMLADAPLVRLVADAIRANGWGPLVVDPVMVASSGDRLLTAEGESVLRDTLVPLATLVTPNLDEAAILTGRPVGDVSAMERAGADLLALGAHAVLVKGGHLTAEPLTDVLVTRAGIRHFRHARLATQSTHGTGCTLSAAVAAGLALGRPLEDAVADALDFVHRAIAAAPGLGSGRGPLNHTVPAPPPR